MIHLRRWLIVSVLFLLLVTVLMLGSLYVALGTETGFRLTSEQLSERIDGLRIGPVEGNLADGIRTSELAFANQQLSINATGIDTSWRSGCLFDRELCIDKVVIDELTIETFANEQPPEPNKSRTDITLPEVALPLSFSAKDVLVKSLKLKLPGDAPAYELDDVSLSAWSEGNVIRIDKLASQYQNIAVVASGTIDPQGDYPVDLSLSIAASNIVDEHDVESLFQFSNTLSDLHVDAQINGALNATLSAKLQPLKADLPATVMLSVPDAGWPLDTREMLNARNLELQIDGDLTDYNLALNGFVSGQQVPDSTLKVIAKLNTERALVTDITALTLDGFATGTAAASWQDGLTWFGELIAKELNPAVKYPQANGKLNALLRASGTVENGKWTLDVTNATLDGTMQNLPFALDARVQKTADNRWILDNFTLNNARNQIVANGSVGTKWDVDATLRMPQLQTLWPGLNGGINADVGIDGALQEPNVQLQANSAGFGYKEVQVNGLFIKADVARAALSQSTALLAMGEVRTGTQSLRNVRVNLAGSREDHTIKLFTDGPSATSLDLVAAGQLASNGDWQGALNKVLVEVPAHQIKLQNKTALAWNNSNKKFSIDAHCWANIDARLCLNNKVLAQDTGSALLELSGYQLAQLDPFLAAGSAVSGKLGATMKIDWGSQYAGGYQAKLDLAVDGGKIDIPDGNGLPVALPYESLTLSTNADANSVDTTFSLESRRLGNASLALQLDPRVTDKPIKGRLDLSNINIAVAKAFLPGFDELAGEINAGADIDGNLLDPLFNGEVTLSKLIVRDDTLPLGFDDGNIATKINGKRANINGKLTSGSGSIDITGSANWARNKWRSNVKLTGKNLTIQQAPVSDSLLNPVINITANSKLIKVRGTVDVAMADINIRDLPKGATTLSSDIVIIEDQIEATRNATSNTNAPTLDVNVAIKLGDKVKLQGYGLVASLGGDFDVSLNSPNPVQLGGEIRIVEGIYKQYGQDLKITDGQILFVGPIDQTRLDIDAVREIEGEDRVAGLQLDGALESPEATLFTEPADKAPEAILSYIVLGRDIGEADDQEANLLAAAAIALTLKGGQSVANGLADSLGMQEISLDARGRGDDTEVLVSGRVNDRLLLRYGRSVFESESTLYVRYDISKQLYLEAAKGAARAVDLFYSFSF